MNNLMTGLEDLKICHVNCQSLFAHFDEFYHFFSKENYHIICLSETWLRPSISDEMVFLPGYKLFRCDRMGRQGGGVAFYLLNAIHAIILNSESGSTLPKPEYIIADITFKDMSKLLLAVVYRPPNVGYIADFFSLFSDLQVNYKHAVILGDFNADMCQTSFESQQLKNLVLDSCLYMVPYNTTHHLRNSSTLLDLVIIDDEDKLLEFGQHDVAFLSAHDLIYIKYKIKIKGHRDRQFVCRDMRNFDVNCFLTDVYNINWEGLLCSDCLDEKISIFNAKILDVYNLHAPLRLRFFKNLPAPWLTEVLRKAMRERDVARRQWRRTKRDDDYGRFKVLRNKAQSMVRSAKRNFYLNAFQKTDNANQTWNRLRHLGLIKPKAVGDGLAHSVEELNEYFAGSNENNGDNCHSDIINVLSGNFDDSSFHWNFVTPLMIRKVISRAKSNAIGIDGISLHVIKLTLDLTLPILEHLFNFSLTRGVFPNQWKSALICPIPKVKSPASVQQYRPISILPALSKALERVVCEQICDYLDKEGLRDPYQSAYRKGYSTQTCLIRMLDEVRSAADSRMLTVSVFFDFSKAFDRVDHVTLLHKLKRLHFSDSVLGWIYSYLTERTQAVKDNIKGKISSLSAVKAGVPQGSVLGPLLFTLYLSDFGNILRYCKYNFYADDLQIFTHCKPKDLHDAIADVNDDIASIHHWTTCNKLLLNSSKTQAIIMGTSRYVNTLNFDMVPKIMVDTNTIQYSTSVKYLGVMLTRNISWEKQVLKTTNKIRSVLYQLKLNKHLIPETLRSKLIMTLITPHIDYCCGVFTDMTHEQNLKLQRALNSCVRFIFNIRVDAHISPYYDKLQWLKVNNRRLYFVGSLLFILLHTEEPKLLSACFSFKNNSSIRASRTPKDVLLQPQCRTELYKRSFRVVAAKLWNGLPSNIRSAKSLNVFKQGLYAHLLVNSNLRL